MYKTAFDIETLRPLQNTKFNNAHIIFIAIQLLSFILNVFF